jgi:hypothetical protein
VWSHPSFPEEAVPAHAQNEAGSAKDYLMQVAESVDISYRALMEGTQRYLEDGEDMCFGMDLDYDTDWEKFWESYASVTGKHVPERQRESFFRCAC